jgi:hypothetical protein
MEPKYQIDRKPPSKNEPNLIMVIRGGYILSKDPLNRKPITIKYLATLTIKLIFSGWIGYFAIWFVYSFAMFEPDSAGRLSRDGRVSRDIFYAQEEFFRANEKFAENQNQLNLPEKNLYDSDRAILKNINNQLSVVMSLTSNSSDGKWHIGTISVRKNSSNNQSELKIFFCRFINKGIVQIPTDAQLEKFSEDGKCPVGTEKIDNRFGTMY